MELIENYEKALRAISEHVGGVDEYIGDYGISMECTDCFFTFFAEDDEISWAKELSDLEEQDGEYYQESCRGFYRGESISLALVKSDFGGHKYWLVFKSSNEIKE